MSNKIGAANSAPRLQFRALGVFIHLVAGGAALTGAVADLYRALADFTRMQKNLVLIGLAVAGVMIAAVAAETGVFRFKPKDGFVPTKEVAIKIAVAVWEPIYGAEHIASKKPYHARLTNGVWIVEGSLPEGVPGGVPEAEISKDDGRILRVSHGQ